MHNNKDNSKNINHHSHNSKPQILLIGGGGHCHSVIDVIEQEDKFQIAGIIEKNRELIGKKILNYKIIASDDDLETLKIQYNFAIITIGQIKNPLPRIQIFKELKRLNFKLPVIISPLAYVSKYAFIDEGTVVMHHALVNSNVKIGKNCIINTKALIEHDSEIEDNCHISTASVVNGGVTVKRNTFFGSNAVSSQGVNIKESTFIKAGSLVK